MTNTRKTILVLEDKERRIELMRQGLATLRVALNLRSWDNAWTMRNELAQWLPSACVISVDFDLRDSLTQSPGEGMDVVQVLSRHQPSCPVIILTSLRAEGQMMARALCERGWKVERVLFSNPEAALDWRDTVEDFVCGITLQQVSISPRKRRTQAVA